jgi:FMN phosphatase YigB (HAD superfamily)
MTPAPLVFLVDIDKTLLDNDRIQDDLRRHLEREFGAKTRDRYRLYPGAPDVLERLRAWGATAILSDGDVVFQPRKVQRSGIWETVDGHVYARDAKAYRPADLTVERIGDLLTHDLPEILSPEVTR